MMRAWRTDLSCGDVSSSPGPPDGTQIAFVSGGTAINVADAAGHVRTVATGPAGSQLHAPSWSPDGATIYYVQNFNAKSQLMTGGKPVFTGEEIFPFRIFWLSPDEYLYPADGEIRRRSLTSAAAVRMRAA